MDALGTSKWCDNALLISKDEVKSLARGGTRIAAETFILSKGIKGTVRILQSTERCLQRTEAALGQLRHAIHNPGSKAREALLNARLMLSTPTEIAPSLARTTEVIIERAAELAEPLIASTSELRPAMQAAEAITKTISKAQPVIQATSSSATQVAGAIEIVKEMNTNEFVPEIGSKLKYVFGKATGSLHNIERSTTMAKQLSRIGIFDNAEGNNYLHNHLKQVFNDPSCCMKVQENGRVVRESLLMGPTGGLKMQSIWDGNKLITIELFG